MVSKIQSTLNRVRADGRIDKKDIQELVKAAADGGGITKTEAAALHKLREQHADLFTRAARDSFDNFLTAMDRSWSPTKNVHLPNIDEDKIKSLLKSDPRIGIYTGRAGSSGKGGGSVNTTPSRPSGGTSGKGGGSVSTPSRPSTGSTGKGGSSTPSRPSPA
ncbi:MAG: hypothetical protein AB2A00_29115, partial [Myxococcota bacterium]